MAWRLLLGTYDGHAYDGLSWPASILTTTFKHHLKLEVVVEIHCKDT